MRALLRIYFIINLALFEYRTIGTRNTIQDAIWFIFLRNFIFQVIQNRIIFFEQYVKLIGRANINIWENDFYFIIEN